MNKLNTVIAIDGFSSCGKSTLAKQLAKALRFAYIDSGAMYRAVTYHLIANEIDLTDLEAVDENIKLINIEFKYINNENCIFLNGLDVSDEIRKMYVSEKVSKVSPIRSVRKAMVRVQQSLGETCDIVMDGRDIGTQVFPYATVKLFMTADPKIRAERRHAELLSKNELVTLEEIMTNLAQRDYDDTTREESPLICATDAIVIDNTHLSMAQQFDLAMEIIETNRKKAPDKRPTS
ncbi:(d)CMP kinase [Pedobacter sp. JY14-1]|uniref:(d)CMP kinase n=1 Tax=Pedobacter sp. JY14-1 TaxID=3034151 RepID=UPI0023E1474B|nr:(d)CMP kinase [Pedobacter sp. JY14-1]